MINLNVNSECKISIVPVIGNVVYSVVFGEDEDDHQYNRFFDYHTDVTAVRCFFKENESELRNNPAWKNVPNVESATRQVLHEAEELEDLIEKLADNTEKGVWPDLDSHFSYLDGVYRNVYEYVPVKSYGTCRPSFLRLYAIKVADNKYVITGGGIKLRDTIQESPGIRSRVFKEIDLTRAYIQSTQLE